MKTTTKLKRFFMFYLRSLGVKNIFYLVLEKFSFSKNKKLIIKNKDGIYITIRNGTNDLYIFGEIYLDNVYEKRYQIEKEDVVFDVGAHIGIFTLKSSRKVQPDGKIFSFEPNKDNYKLLQENIKLNNISNVIYFNKAVNSNNSDVILYVNKENTGGSSVIFKNEIKEKILIPAITLDEVVESYGLSKINLLKIDVEGNEYEVLKGAKKTLKICENLVIETHEKEGGPSNIDLIKKLEKNKFQTELITITKENDIIYAKKNKNKDEKIN